MNSFLSFHLHLILYNCWQARFQSMTLLLFFDLAVYQRVAGLSIAAHLRNWLVVSR